MTKKKGGASIDKKNSSSSVKKTLHNLLTTGLMLTAGVLATNLSMGQTTNTVGGKEKKETTEQVNTPTKKIGEENTLEIDSLDHERIIHTNVDSLLMEYGEEKGMEIINVHFDIEINKLRQKVQVSDIDTSYEVQKSSQKQVEFLDKTGKIQHMSGNDLLPKRLEREGIVFVTCGENLADGQKCIQQLIEDRLVSPTHKANLINKKFKKMGLGYKNGKWVYIAIG